MLEGLAEYGRAIIKDPQGLRNFDYNENSHCPGLSSISTSTLHRANVSFHPNTITHRPEGEALSLMCKIVINCFVMPQATYICQFGKKID
jgi:hypothetical protein